MRTKQEVQDEIRDIMEPYLETLGMTPLHSVYFVNELKELYDQFMKEVQKTIFLEPLPKHWKYAWDMDLRRFQVELLHYADEEEGYVDQRIMMVEFQVPRLSVEEFAAMYHVPENRVRQWLRRARIKSAYKAGNTWRIPALAELPQAIRFDHVGYRIEGYLDNVPEKYKLLREYRDIGIERKKGIYEVTLYKQEGEVPDKSFMLNKEEKDAFEYALVAAPEIRYIENIQESFWFEAQRAAMQKGED